MSNYARIEEASETEATVDQSYNDKERRAVSLQYATSGLMRNVANTDKIIKF